jgi:hypothetical protein
MRKVAREDLLDYQSYGDQRESLRARAMRHKDQRRIHVGDHLTFLFENAETVRYQIQEMMRLERMAREADIQHELDTYNQLLGDDGELGCTLLVEIDDPELRDRKLRQWLDLPSHVFMVTDRGRTVRAAWDPSQVGEDRLSSVQYLKFAFDGDAPVAIGVDHPGLAARVDLDPIQREALARDLAGG